MGSGWGVGGSVEKTDSLCLSGFQKILGGVLAKMKKCCRKCSKETVPAERNAEEQTLNTEMPSLVHGDAFYR